MGFDTVALVFKYGQRHDVEVQRATQLAEDLHVPYRVQTLDLRSVGGSALTSSAIEVPKNRSEEEIGSGPIPPTYVPARNTIFLAHALAWAEVEEIDEVFVGMNTVDYSGYPDCRPEYLEAFERLGNLASRRSTQDGKAWRLHAPLLHKTKSEIIRWGTELGVDYSRTWSCYAPGKVDDGRAGESLASFAPCGECDSCLIRKRGFREAGVEDPTEYLVK